MNKEIQTFLRFGDKYSDVTITFYDQKERISMRLHRIFLAWKVPYFDTLFSFAENLQKKEFTIPVEDARVAELFMESLYGQLPQVTSPQRGQEVYFTPDCYNFLHLCKLRSYFCLNVDLEGLYQIKVPPENFDLFLQVVSLPEIELSKKLIKTIRRNLPSDYNWEGINEEFKREILKREKYILMGYCNDILIWNLYTIDEEDVNSENCAKILTGHKGQVKSVVITKDRKQIISGSEDETIKIWSMSSGECVKTLTGHRGQVKSIVIAEEQQQIISASADQTIKIWSMSSGECVKTLTGHTDWVSSMIITKDQLQIISGSHDKTIKIWNLASGECVKTLIGHTDWIKSIVFVENQQKIISASTDWTIKIWEVASGKCIKTMLGHTDSIITMVVTEDQEKIISAGGDETIKIWNLASGECVKTLTGHTDWVMSVVVTEDQEKIISSSDDGTVRIWNSSDGKCIKTLTDYTDVTLFYL